jgi:hypothetical protein
MSFGRSKNMSRRAFRPDGGFHRSKRRKNLGTLLNSTSASRSPFSLLLKPLQLLLSFRRK